MKISDPLVSDANSEIKGRLSVAKGLMGRNNHAGALEETLMAIAAQQVIIGHFWAILGNPE